jgi:plasmid maintenance system antidote protein VapI
MIDVDVGAVGTRLREAMAGRSVHRIARSAHVPRWTIQALLGGRRKQGPCLGTLVALADACGVSPVWLAFGVEVPNGAQTTG